ncbi:polymer-forming cytoskeletal protein, partial [candidate division WOR-3 bacterium]|nr:polymer-forming cytoskeletal protein [candidate division WOR-3 bacterium]
MNEKARTGMTNIIGEGTEINGKILVPGSIRVDGKIDGDITVSDQITIGKAGFLKGVLLTRDAVVAGRMEGTITVKNRIELQKNAKVNIDLKCKLLIIEEGV